MGQSYVIYHDILYRNMNKYHDIHNLILYIHCEVINFQDDSGKFAYIVVHLCTLVRVLK